MLATRPTIINSRAALEEFKLTNQALRELSDLSLDKLEGSSIGLKGKYTYSTPYSTFTLAFDKALGAEHRTLTVSEFGKETNIPFNYGTRLDTVLKKLETEITQAQKDLKEAMRFSVSEGEILKRAEKIKPYKIPGSSLGGVIFEAKIYDVEGREHLIKAGLHQNGTTGQPYSLDVSCSNNLGTTKLNYNIASKMGDTWYARLKPNPK